MINNNDDKLCCWCNLVIFVLQALHYLHISRLSSIQNIVTAGSGNGNDNMGMRGNENYKSHSRTQLLIGLFYETDDERRH